MLPAAMVVAASGVASPALELLAAWVAPRFVTAPPWFLFPVIPALLLGFWAVSGWLIDAGARLMAAPSRPREILAAAGHCFIVFAAFGVVTVLQALALRLGAGSGGSWAIGWLDAPLLIWFVVLLGVAVVSVYRGEAPSALALALLPFAALVAALLLSGVAAAVLSGAHRG
jgi:hypothetical protein